MCEYCILMCYALDTDVQKMIALGNGRTLIKLLVSC